MDRDSGDFHQKRTYRFFCSCPPVRNLFPVRIYPAIKRCGTVVVPIIHTFRFLRDFPRRLFLVPFPLLYHPRNTSFSISQKYIHTYREYVTPPDVCDAAATRVAATGLSESVNSAAALAAFSRRTAKTGICRLQTKSKRPV